MLMMKILSGIVIRMRSSVLPAICIGSQISCRRFKLKIMSQNLADAGERPHRESQFISLKLKSLRSIRSLVTLLKDCK